MCMGRPVQIEALFEGQMAQVTLEGVVRRISVAMIDPPRLGDYVTVHAGMAWDRLDPEEAAEILSAIDLACVPPDALN
ncbi:hypothetical protein CKO11_11615 [Rhodobacter sp. TJ_12]|uniref:HypC/HybG/HupF family hydrogenase formation chaperone n=1 Tax=Rhodobacter sp. TJ_12 TaxID=2029399 RepID=UPI001CBD9039|nr:HypC/HybG/HupF family hydrogenase formation chaperone [Rhodobacter sp. TJ_12]MBZ4023107.1 hypothetical protein [Rhodobacter sp. TJ_12]